MSRPIPISLGLLLKKSCSLSLAVFAVAILFSSRQSDTCTDNKSH